jgi:transcription antitermination factor NusG
MAEPYPKIRICRPLMRVSDQFSTVSDSALQWFAAYTTSRHEKHVGEVLAERNIESFLPLYRTVRQWKKSTPVTLELPLFPCYLFVRINRAARGAVLSLPGVVSIVGSPKEPWPLPQLEVEALRLGAKLGKAEPHPYLRVGERVRIKAGLMAGVQGILVRKRNEFRFVLTLEAIMRSVAVEVDASELELVDQPLTKIHETAEQSGLGTN